jgi:hypothetical protein
MAEKVSATANVAGVPWTIYGYINPNFGISATANQPTAQAGTSQTAATAATTSAAATKVATPALLALSNKPLDSDIMADLIFENIGGQELINIARNDLINGQDVLYTPIKNLRDLYLQYNANNIIRLENAADTYFKNFPIRLENRLPYTNSGVVESAVYLDSEGNLVINVSNLEKDEQVEVQILNSGEILDGTIYQGTV